MKPNFVVRLDPAIRDAARQAAQASGRRVGLWLEEAIREKLERDQNARKEAQDGTDR